MDNIKIEPDMYFATVNDNKLVLEKSNKKRKYKKAEQQKKTVISFNKKDLKQ